jgi:hypothetical protein
MPSNTAPFFGRIRGTSIQAEEVVLVQSDSMGEADRLPRNEF